MVTLPGHQTPLHLQLQEILDNENIPCQREVDTVIRSVQGINGAREAFSNPSPKLFDLAEIIEEVRDARSVPRNTGQAIFPLAEVMQDGAIFDFVPKEQRDRFELQARVLFDLASHGKARDPQLLDRVVKHPHNRDQRTYGQLLAETATDFANVAASFVKAARDGNNMLRNMTSMAQEYADTGDIRTRPAGMDGEMFEGFRGELKSRFDVSTEGGKREMLAELQGFTRGIQENADYAAVMAHVAQQMQPLSIAMIKAGGMKDIGKVAKPSPLPPELSALEGKEFFIQPLYNQGQPAGYTIRVALPEYNDHPNKHFELASLGIALRNHTGQNFKQRVSKSTGSNIEVLEICEHDKGPASHRQPNTIVFSDIAEATAMLEQLRSKGLTARLPEKGPRSDRPKD